MAQTICITGATGFVGRHLIAQLASRGDLSIVALTRKPSIGLPAGVQVVQGELRSAESMRGFLREGATVVNLAYDKSWSPNAAAEATRDLARACRHAHVSGLVHVSTAVVVGASSHPVITESTPATPATAYERAKLAAEEALLGELSGSCNVVIVRPTAVFGEGGLNLIKAADELTRGPAWMRWLRRQVYADRAMNLVYVGNVIAALIHLIGVQANVRGERFIVSDDADPLNEYASVAALLARELGLPSDRYPAIGALRHALPLLLRMRGRSNVNRQRRYSAAKLAATGFRAPFTLEEGIRRFAAWYREAASA